MINISLKITNENISTLLKVDMTNDEILIDRSTIGKNEKEKLTYNLYGLARSNRNVKKLIVELSNNGFYLIDHSQGISTFKKLKKPYDLIRNKNKNNIKSFESLLYTLNKPLLSYNKNRLIVVFSSVADFPYNADITRRNFFENFKSISKYIPTNTYILRISDIGGVVGSFYLNNNFNKKIEENVQGLIKKIANEANINKDDIVLYGTSKGGTGSLYHSILGGYKAVSVDPIVTDHFHEKFHNDSHFTEGTFPITKKEAFSNLLKRTEIIKGNVNIIYSINSPIYNEIESTIKDNDHNDNINYYNIEHPNIKSHPDVGPNTINILMLLINNLFYEIAVTDSKNIDSSVSPKKSITKSILTRLKKIQF